ncbi:hypothetical protein KG091_00195 [Carnobacteriaceae bacterium zg-ZUI78]|nr:hypothetical protein [Carnobacteriaceae bacterium zg-ZUI78]
MDSIFWFNIKIFTKRKFLFLLVPLIIIGVIFFYFNHLYHQSTNVELSEQLNRVVNDLKSKKEYTDEIDDMINEYYLASSLTQLYRKNKNEQEFIKAYYHEYQTLSVLLDNLPQDYHNYFDSKENYLKNHQLHQYMLEKKVDVFTPELNIKIFDMIAKIYAYGIISILFLFLIGDLLGLKVTSITLFENIPLTKMKISTYMHFTLISLYFMLPSFIYILGAYILGNIHNMMMYPIVFSYSTTHIVIVPYYIVFLVTGFLQLVFSYISLFIFDKILYWFKDIIFIQIILVVLNIVALNIVIDILGRIIYARPILL